MHKEQKEKTNRIKINICKIEAIAIYLMNVQKKIKFDEDNILRLSLSFYRAKMNFSLEKRNI